MYSNCGEIGLLPCAYMRGRWRPVSCPAPVMMSTTRFIVLLVLVTMAFADPIQPFPENHLPIAAVAELSSRLAAHTPHVQALQDPAAGRLPLPTPSDIEAIKKVAQILITLGQQVIPAIIGEPSSMASNCESTGEDAQSEDSP